ncbi:MAG: tyrosine--tRNA ligase [Gemmatimonadaceae bacterium]
MTEFLSELQWRGLHFQSDPTLGEALAKGGLSAYCGFDPTASSLHLGHLVPVMALMHLQRAGNRPIALVGGGTGMIGDPGGRTAERQLNAPDVVERYTDGIRSQLERFLDFSGTHGALMRNNADWLRPLGAIDFLRDIGKHFTVNYMLQKDSVKSRMEDGISYTEFSYMLLQAYDYLELFRREGVTLQIGGSDQWGNITAGMELIRRVDGGDAHALTLPLVTTAAGTKFGKTEAGAVWLDAERTSPYQFYQFWINADDRDAGRYLRYFTLLSREEINTIERAMAEHPERREAQRALADDVTTRVHGAEAARAAGEVSALLFGKADPSTLSTPGLDALAREIPTATVTRDASGVIGTVGAFATAFGMSKSEARRLLSQGALSVDGRKLGVDDTALGEASLPGSRLLLRKGGRSYCLVTARG